ncbi:MAG: hypothetical protein ACPG8V_04670 [Alphaproteobacteria bacterium]
MIYSISKIDNKILLIAVNIILLVKLFYAPLTGNIEHISTRDSSLLTFLAIFLTVFAIRKQYEDNQSIRKKTKKILIVICIMFASIAFEYINAIHIDIPRQYNNYLKTGIAPTGQTQLEFIKMYAEYIKKYPLDSNLHIHFTLLFGTFLKFFVYLYMGFVFIKFSYFNFKNRNLNDNIINILFILPLFYPVFIGVYLFPTLIYMIKDIFL